MRAGASRNARGSGVLAAFEIRSNQIVLEGDQVSGHRQCKHRDGGNDSLHYHRYIEAVSSSQDINLDYQKGAKKLKEVAEQYLVLDLNPESEDYRQKLGKKLQEKAQLFESRSKITADDKNKSEIKQLLQKMDSVTKERLNAINSLESQCELIND